MEDSDDDDPDLEDLEDEQREGSDEEEEVRDEPMEVDNHPEEVGCRAGFSVTRSHVSAIFIIGLINNMLYIGYFCQVDRAIFLFCKPPLFSPSQVKESVFCS